MIRVAILGAGIGREHLAAFRKLGDTFEVVAVVDRDLARIEEIRNEESFDALDDIDTVLARPDIDLVDVCLPPHLHVPVTLQALEAKKHVVCEKPVATSIADVELLKMGASVHDRTVFPVFQYRWGPSLSQLRHLVAEGLAGRLNAAALETHWSRDAAYYAAPWRGTWAGEQGGAVLGHAIHNHDLLTHFAGDIATVSAICTTRINDIETEDCAAISFEMTSGAICTSNITLGASGDESRLRFVFDKLTATSGTEPYAPGNDVWSFKARNPEDQGQINAAIAQAPEEPSGFEGFFTEVGKAIHGEPNTAVTLEDGLASVQLVSAIYYSARTGHHVHLPLSKDHPFRNGWLPSDDLHTQEK